MPNYFCCSKEQFESIFRSIFSFVNRNIIQPLYSLPWATIFLYSSLFLTILAIFQAYSIWNWFIYLFYDLSLPSFSFAYPLFFQIFQMVPQKNEQSIERIANFAMEPNNVVLLQADESIKEMETHSTALQKDASHYFDRVLLAKFRVAEAAGWNFNELIKQGGKSKEEPFVEQILVQMDWMLPKHFLEKQIASPEPIHLQLKFVNAQQEVLFHSFRSVNLLISQFEQQPSSYRLVNALYYCSVTLPYQWIQFFWRLFVRLVKLFTFSLIALDTLFLDNSTSTTTMIELQPITTYTHLLLFNNSIQTNHVNSIISQVHTIYVTLNQATTIHPYLKSATIHIISQLQGFAYFAYHWPILASIFYLNYRLFWNTIYTILLILGTRLVIYIYTSRQVISSSSSSLATTKKKRTTTTNSNTKKLD